MVEGASKRDAALQPLEHLHSTHLNDIRARRTGSECRRYQLVHRELIALIAAEREVVSDSAVDQRDDRHQHVAVNHGYLHDTDRANENRRGTRV